MTLSHLSLTLKATVKPRYTLAELAEQAGIPARTVRYYIARGLVDGPDKAGRDAGYSARHAAQLARIRKMQAGGRTLAAIAHETSDRRAESVPPAKAWWSHEIGGDVIVLVKADSRPWRIKQIREAIAGFAARLEPQGGRDDE